MGSPQDTVGSSVDFVLSLLGKACRETLLMSIKEHDFFIYSFLNLTVLLVLVSYIIAENIVTRQEYNSSII